MSFLIKFKMWKHGLVGIVGTTMLCVLILKQINFMCCYFCQSRILILFIVQ